MEEQFLRTSLLLGKDNIEKLFKSKVAVIGLGAVGSFATEILARVGIGNLLLVDFDTIQTTNLNRQLYALQEVFTIKPDIVIDAIDSYNPKLRLIEYCYKNNIEIISSMGAALKTDPFSIKYADLFETHHCKLAERLRGDLRSLGISSGIHCVFSEQSPQIKPIPLPKKEGEKYGKNGGPKILGSTPVITGIFGILLANKAISIITENKN